MFETLMNTNRTSVLFGSVQCGAELEQTEHDFENVLFCFFVRLAISGLKNEFEHRLVGFQHKDEVAQRFTECQ